MNSKYNIYNMTQTDKIKNQKFTKTHIHMMMTHMSMNEGIKKFGNKGNDSLLKELNQLHQ